MKYLRLLKIFALTSIANQIAYRQSFIFAVMGKTARVTLLIVLFDVIYSYVDTIAGWSRGGAFLVLATYLSIEWLALVTFHRNMLYWSPTAIRSGYFDFWLTKPVSVLFYAAFLKIDFMDMTTGAVIAVVWWRAIRLLQLTVSLPTAVIFSLFFALAYVILFSLSVFITSSVFWTTTRTGLGRLFESTIQVARYPVDIFSRPVQGILFSVVPIGFIATFPAQILLGTAPLWLMAWGVVITVIFFSAAKATWSFALKHYSSASS